jgi:hypothetical protein
VDFVGQSIEEPASEQKNNRGNLMKVVALREAKASLSGYIEKAQQDRILRNPASRCKRSRTLSFS